MSRPLKARIDLNAFRQNYLTAKRLHGGKSLAVIKANAYGHGAIECAKAIDDIADAFAVASLEEAKQLREAGVILPILLLEGFFCADELAEVVRNDCWIVIHSAWQLEALARAQISQPLHIWLKVDTGMHRLGFSVDDIHSVYAQLRRIQCVEQIVLMTHFANADNIALPDTHEQLLAFSGALTAVAVAAYSVANSAAVLAWQSSQIELLQGDYEAWSRPGIMLYGANPLIGDENTSQLLPVMTLSSELIAIQTLKAGDSIGYGSLFTAPIHTRVGVVACGYADGYPRVAINSPVVVRGLETRVVGRVSMDMLYVDLTNVPEADIGDEVELWGARVLANDVATAAGTSAYELFCNVKRARFEYNNG